MKVLLIIIFACFLSHSVFSQLPPKTISLITTEINKVRTNGIRCGNTRMPPVHKIYWKEELYGVSLDYATYMNDHKHFAHVSKEGEDAGMRLDNIGYNWRFVGENIAVGQYDFPEVLEDWIESESHCKMLMSKDMHHFAVARNEKYWVQTFATPMRQ